MRPLVRAAASLVAVLALGCGAKTGLRQPDASLDARVPSDAGRDAGRDARVVLPPRQCIEVPADGSASMAAFTTPVSLSIVDVMFVIDASGSMADEIDNVRQRLRGVVVPGVEQAIPDAAFGLAYIGEFPVQPHGGARVRPYELRSSITTDVLVLEGALGSAPSWGNEDEPEAQVEGLYQVSTGDGLLPWIQPSDGCPRGGSGGACFRGDAFHVIVLITDAPMHNGPPGIAPSAPYRFTSPQAGRGPHTWTETLEALRSVRAVVVGLGASDRGRQSAMPHLRALASATGAVDGAGLPLAFDIGNNGADFGQGVVDAISALASGLPLDVDARVEDVPGDAFDARAIVTAIVASSASPPSGVRGMMGAQFFGVAPGTRVTYSLTLSAASLPPSTVTRRIPGRVVFRASGSRLGTVDVDFLIPGADGGGCGTGTN